MSFEMSSEEFFLQLGPEFKEYAIVFNDNGFKDVSTICTMEVQEDLMTMFPDGKMPLGHRRKIEAAVRNLKNATQLESASRDDQCGTSGYAVKGTTDSCMFKLKDNNDSKLAKLQGQLQKSMAKQRELKSFIPLPEPDGPFKHQTCSVCHLRGHRSDGNKNRSCCEREPCTSWKFCGRQDKHKTEISRIKRDQEKEIKDLTNEIKELKEENEKINTFAERSITSFMFVMKPRLKAIDPTKYQHTNLLMRDLLMLKEKYENKIPVHDPSLDSIALPKALSIINDLKRKNSFNIVEAEAKKTCLPTTTCTITSPIASSTVTSAQQMTFPMYQQYYPYGYPMYYNPYMYNYPGTTQPPFPTTPPPVNPPMPEGEPPK